MKMMDSATRVRLTVLPFHLNFIASSLSCIDHNDVHFGPCHGVHRECVWFSVALCCTCFVIAVCLILCLWR